ADFDTVSDSNLNRQFYFHDQIGEIKVNALRENLLRINPFASLQMHAIRVAPGNIDFLFSTCDIIVEAFDDASEKEMLINYILTNYPEKPVVAASGLAGWGSMDSLRVVESGNLYVCGDGESEAGESNPPLAPRVNIVSNLQADKVLEILLKDRF
ncbi:MAG: sulfur carrier protein ThiS adenylyltransferase ThiF, partial [Bacteroidales bacterium]|nr:sulfur carrier protein ThiS adenylyltransferase ThiF [Bacteroidales bacterium]